MAALVAQYVGSIGEVRHELGQDPDRAEQGLVTDAIVRLATIGASGPTGGFFDWSGPVGW